MKDKSFESGNRRVAPLFPEKNVSSVYDVVCLFYAQFAARYETVGVDAAFAVGFGGSRFPAPIHSSSGHGDSVQQVYIQSGCDFDNVGYFGSLDSQIPLTHTTHTYWFYFKSKVDFLHPHSDPFQVAVRLAAKCWRPITTSRAKVLFGRASNRSEVKSSSAIRPENLKTSSSSAK